MFKRARSCPITGVPLKDVDDAWLAEDGKSLDTDKLKAEFPDCDAFGPKMIADQIYTPANPTSRARLRSFERRLKPPGMPPSSHYHLHQLRVGIIPSEGPTLYATHANVSSPGIPSSLQQGNLNYEAAVGEARRQAITENNYFRRGSK